MIAILLLVKFPDQAVTASWWYLTHAHYVIGVAVLVDLVVWWGVYRRYRRDHPYEKVVLRR